MNIVARALIQIHADDITAAAARLLEPVADISGARLPAWWRWTAYLAVAITARRVTAAKVHGFDVATGKIDYRSPPY